MRETDFAQVHEPWNRERGLQSVLEAWKSNPQRQRNIVLDHLASERDAAFAPIPEALFAGAKQALDRRGLTQIYSHQHDAVARAIRGEHLVIATPTASGKSLCYNLPVLDALGRNPQARALYLFPTKALARDQEASLRDWMQAAGLPQGAIAYDGDTPGDARRVAREKGGVLLTNPDMLHAGILPHHANWARFFASLSYVVIDELHTYRGVFGSHLANVLRRLRRIARFHGSNPTFLFASATIGNPGEHAARMLGESVGVVSESGAPSGARQLIVYNPPVVNPELGLRASYVKTAVDLTADLVLAKVPTIVFGPSRNQVEIMLKYLRERVAAAKIDPETIQGYRSGYLPETRRRIETGLRSGAVRAVVATSALELGIDIGSLDAVVCAGYPGSLAALFQRFGRAGRRQGTSLALLVTNSNPLDQYVAQSPEFLTNTPIEEARIDPDNLEILVSHLKCASFELPFEVREGGESFGGLSAAGLAESLDYLADHNVLHRGVGPEGGSLYTWATEVYPASHVSLRSASWDNFVIIDVDTNKTIAEMDHRATHTMLHVQAIYQHEAEQYQVERLDFENHKAYVRHVEPDYFTTAMTYTTVDITQSDRCEPLPQLSTTCSLGEVSVVEKVVGYKKIKYNTHENVGYGEVRLPEMQMHTSAVWFTIPEHELSVLGFERAIAIDALRSVAHAFHLVASVGLMCDGRDLGHCLKDPRGGESQVSAAILDPTMFFYDSIAGGVGLAPRIFENRERLAQRAYDLIAHCACEQGCPTCIGVASLAAQGSPATAQPSPVTQQSPRTKLVAIALLRAAFGVQTLQ